MSTHFQAGEIRTTDASLFGQGFLGHTSRVPKLLEPHCEPFTRHTIMLPIRYQEISPHRRLGHLLTRNSNHGVAAGSGGLDSFGPALNGSWRVLDGGLADRRQ